MNPEAVIYFEECVHYYFGKLADGSSDIWNRRQFRQEPYNVFYESCEDYVKFKRSAMIMNLFTHYKWFRQDNLVIIELLGTLNKYRKQYGTRLYSF